MNFKIKCISNKHNSGDFTIGRIYEVKDGVVYGNREYNSGNQNYYDSIKEINKDFVPQFELVKENANFKVRCISNRYGNPDFTIGKIYKIIDGALYGNGDSKSGSNCYHSVEKINKAFIPQFELVKENFNFKIKCIDSKNGWFTKGKIYDVNNGILAVNNGSTFKNMYSVECINNNFNAQFELYEKSLKEKYLQPNKDNYIVLELKNGVFGIIIDGIIYYDDNSFDRNVDILDDNLSYGDEEDYVVRIYHKNKYQGYLLNYAFDIRFLNLVWQRENIIPEYTLDELIEKIGHNFKIRK